MILLAKGKVLAVNIEARFMVNIIFRKDLDNLHLKNQEYTKIETFSMLGSENMGQFIPVIVSDFS